MIITKTISEESKKLTKKKLEDGMRKKMRSTIGLYKEKLATDFDWRVNYVS